MINKGSWVRVKKTLLKSSDRSTNLPIDTSKVDLVMFVKGYLLENANIGDYVEIKTIIDRTESGILMESNPSYLHNYGEFVPEILEISKQVRLLLFGENNG